MNMPIVRPRALRPGETIAIIAPAGPVEGKDDLLKGVSSLERMGFQVRFDERIFHSLRYLAGPDEERAEELMRAFEDHSVRAIISLRGGFGCSRLIPLIDRRRLRTHCKVFMGFSDLTTLHLYFRRHFGWVTFHGPMATSSALADIQTDHKDHLLALWTDPAYLPKFRFPQLKSWHAGTAEGELAGGCLSLLVASLGTPYELNSKEKILFLEDLAEPPYRIDRMLTQLRLARKLDHVAGVLLGNFKDCEPDNAGYSSEDVLHDALDRLQVPVIANFPSGHGSENWTLPLGTRVMLDASNRCVSALEAAVSND